MAFRRPFSLSLDGGLVAIGDGQVRTQPVQIDAGEFATPAWLRTEAGLVVPVGSLPWRGRFPAGSLEVLSADPSASELPSDLRVAIEWSTGLGTGTLEVRDTGRATPFTQTQGSGDFEVVNSAAEGVSFPCENHLVTYANIASAGFTELHFSAADGYIPTLEIGHGVKHRYYYSLGTLVPGTELGGGDGMHGEEYGEPITYPALLGKSYYDSSPQRWTMQSYPWVVSPSTFRGYQLDIGGPSTYSLLPETVYRIEVGWFRFDSTQAYHVFNVYVGEGTTPVVTSSDFTSDFYDSGGFSFDGALLTMNSASWAGVGNWKVGCNGLTACPSRHVLSRQTGLAIQSGASVDLTVLESPWPYNPLEKTFTPS